MPLTLEDIEAAQVRVRGVALTTPLVYSQTLSRQSGREVFFKLEKLQTTGSFKLRGALGGRHPGGGRVRRQPCPGRGLCRRIS